MAKVIAFSSQKGGPGKTTLTQLVATDMFSKGTKLMVFDADNPQHSFERSRKRDLLVGEDGVDPAQALQEIGMKPYLVNAVSMNELIRTLPLVKTSNDLQLIFLDLPGTLNVDNFSTLAKEIDLCIIPVENEFKSFGAAMDTVDFYQTHSPSTRLALIWTKLKRSHKINERKGLEDAFKARGLYVFDFILWETVQIGQNISTIYPLELIEPFVNELHASKLLDSRLLPIVK